MLTARLFQQFVFWSVWLIIPLIWEVITGLLSAAFVLIKRRRKNPVLSFYPKVTVLVPAFNSENTLRLCLESVINQDYPRESTEIFIIDNGINDTSSAVFQQLQAAYPEINLWRYSSPQGKSKALNKGIFSSTGKYIINIDSDGWLERSAVKNIVTRFESDERITCMTGVVLIDPTMVEKTPSIWLKLLRRCELFEYTETFLVGRSFQSSFNSIYTLSGAFSCFRREVLQKTQMYNTETIGEDTHMTFQVRSFVGGKIALCENAFLYTEPIENLDRLYIQRQRWQRGELEVASLFKQLHTGNLWGFFRKFPMRILISDHTLTFPRLIWFFAVIYLYFINYPLELLIGANVLLYTIYVTSSLLYTCTAAIYLDSLPGWRTYLRKHQYMCFLTPVYRFMVYWIRIAGMVNSLSQDPKWHADTLTDEVRTLKTEAAGFTRKFLPLIYKLKRSINNE